ncbi:MAG TPA: ABC transporter substrate-binding protein [Sulfuricella sp.]|nr:ABC transporter substrate-binding protein [Sulfuricella sp.]
MKKAFYPVLFLMAVFWAATASAVAAEVAPDVLVKETAQDVLAIVKKDKDIQAGNKKKIYELVDAKVLPHFDFRRMTMLAVGKDWRQATPAQQESLVREFRTLLVRTYSTSLSAYKNQTIEYKPLRMESGETDVLVKTVVKQPDGQPPIPIDYRLQKTANGWKVYDVIVDNISLVTNYRGSFSSEIRKSGIDSLIKTLIEKNRSSESQGSKG